MPVSVIKDAEQTTVVGVKKIFVLQDRLVFSDDSDDFDGQPYVMPLNPEAGVLLPARPPDAEDNLEGLDGIREIEVLTDEKGQLMVLIELVSPRSIHVFEDPDTLRIVVLDTTSRADRPESP